jgi:NADPH:quinone reductase-like Zn-dependent oxidoreductase
MLKRAWCHCYWDCFQTRKATQAAQAGCHHPIIYNSKDVVARVNTITSEKGVNVVYDSVGKDTFKVLTICAGVIIILIL